ncbi:MULTISPECIES: 6-phosphogluconolactonase [unclassified Caulobacter]|uniref:6-phosphogluconolactonase n=1 Tax=unclassified Caulobacter TaxID=2648921 RepID=UPI000D39081B|nr:MULTISPECIES: 6-phosphogluconolactonase [unclassified Caulobacter]PTS89759.1 6-phosphogluconolactonase [Caulobacter sp. HMWF009]PTT05075.1 6-phosphogluconolactonase [Caulobacter sp. HMWF025]
MSLPTIETFASREALYDAAAALLVTTLTEAVNANGKAGFAATGGSTPAPVYERMSTLAAPWDKVTVTLTDERFVPPSDASSNEGLVRRHLLKGQAASARFAPLFFEGLGFDAAAKAAEAGVAEALPFGVVVLGVGGDGHFASLFPGSIALAEGLDPATDRLVLAVPAGQPAPDLLRLSLTLAALTQTSLIVLLVTGQAKRDLLQAPVDPALPVAAILNQDRVPVRILWAE